MHTCPTCGNPVRFGIFCNMNCKNAYDHSQPFPPARGRRYREYAHPYEGETLDQYQIRLHKLYGQGTLDTAMKRNYWRQRAERLMKKYGKTGRDRIQSP